MVKTIGYESDDLREATLGVVFSSYLQAADVPAAVSCVRPGTKPVSQVTLGSHGQQVCQREMPGISETETQDNERQTQYSN